MNHRKRALLAAGLIAGAAAMTGCTAATTPVTTPTPQAAQQQTAQPGQASPDAGSQAAPIADAEETAAPLSIEADGKKLEADAFVEEGKLMLPLIQTAQALGWKAKSEEAQEESGVRKTITLEKENSRMTVSWTVSDNTTRQITWQKDGLLIPVDAHLTTMDGIVYVPAAFFEEAAGAKITQEMEGVSVLTPAPKDTPLMQEEQPAQG